MKLVILLVCLTWPWAANAVAGEGSFLSVNGEKIFVRHDPAQKGKSTLVLLNGLTYSTSQWGSFASALEKIEPGVGVLRYDMKGMGNTLLAGTLPVNYSISLASQVAQLKGLLKNLGLQKVSLVGLSYGGGVAIAFAKAYPELIDRLFLLAPFTEALENQDRLIKAEIAATRATYPFNPASDEELYDFFLRQFIYSTYPSSEPVVLENPFKLEAVYRMVQGIRHFRAEELASDMPAGSVHLMVANQDQYIPKEVLNRFWMALPQSARASRIDISYTEHKIPEAIPHFAAAWILTVLKENLTGEFQGESWAFRARSKDKVIQLPRP